LGRQLVFYDRFNVMSYAMARLKAEANNYRNEDPRISIVRYEQGTTEADLRKILADDRHRKYVAKGGAWWLHTEPAKAKARGDRKRFAQIQKQLHRDLKASGASLRKAGPRQ